MRKIFIRIRMMEYRVLFTTLYCQSCVYESLYMIHSDIEYTLRKGSRSRNV